MIGILVDENNELKITVKRDANGMITQGLQLDNIDFQRCKFIIVAQKGEFKQVPTLGLGIDNYLKKPITSHSRQQFITELKSELSSDGITAPIRVDGNDISKFDIDI
ncbi:hypothetical protein [Dysgonomonas sp. HGC4]|uniref:hypothetical protein n=1 Tax=Dysgonomonas sp. HGC4 TaxID=1658009 RepID=UPI000682C779|nr:hypothetical protein [Dysgonomonas sp. HGC4]MBD8348576.1 hypothetical protein [Dysgonomonas sp. HGC4]